ncbi:Mif2/CENP-C like-domain-containing protein [Hypoxylon crocopeplum]|nr:Mif2/CENP-C like-domain-containing protein [Hypoxylon crocopeplum]
MAPSKSQSQRRMTQSQNEQVYDLGVHGRKTGLILAERQRDEHGFETVDNLFSSPEKDVNNVTVNAANEKSHLETDDEQEMDIDDESQMGPATTMKQQRQHRLSIPRGRSPMKTNLQSPARQNPHLGPTSSPTRGSIVTAREPSPPRAVNRRLDFSKGPQSKTKPPVNGQPKVNGTNARNGKLTNGRAHASDSDDDEVILRGRPRRSRGEPEDREESPEFIDAGDDEVDPIEDVQDDSRMEPEPVAEEEEEEHVQQSQPAQPPKKRRGRKPKSPVAQEEEGESSIVEPAPAQIEEVNHEPVKKKRGRPAKTAPSPKEPEPPKKSPKRRRSGRNSLSSVDEEQDQEQEQEQEQEDNVEERKTKRQRTEEKESKSTASKPTATKEKGRPGRKRKSSGIGVDEPVVQRGPPLPRGRGLVTLRQEDEATMRTTRSGRPSYRPLAFWRGEHTVNDSTHVVEDKGRRFVMAAVKGVVRASDADYSPPPRKRRGRPAKQTSKSGRRSSALIEEEEVERDQWEYDPGRITGECLFWQPENEMDEDQPEVVEEELAVSEAAVQLKDIKDATFRFAKTLTMPFFGSGVVDMPPGSEKRTKNSRKMQMVFFVHAGSVEVTVAQTEFRIGKGGMWFVPRGNHYSIMNNTDKPARIFFAQGCEVVVEGELGGEESRL